MTDLNQLLNSSIAPLGFGGAAGAMVGYAAKKLSKLAAILLGVLFITLQILAHMGFIQIQWGSVQSTAAAAWKNPEGTTLADHAWQIITVNLPFGGGFITGFAIGFKLG